MCVHVCVYMCICICMYMYICVSVYMYAYTYIHTRVGVHMHSCRRILLICTVQSLYYMCMYHKVFLTPACVCGWGLELRFFFGAEVYARHKPLEGVHLPESPPWLFWGSCMTPPFIPLLNVYDENQREIWFFPDFPTCGSRRSIFPHLRRHRRNPVAGGVFADLWLPQVEKTRKIWKKNMKKRDISKNHQKNGRKSQLAAARSKKGGGEIRKM